MHGMTFKEPVVVWLDHRRPEFGTKAIDSVADGLAALHRFGLGDCRLDEKGRPRREWALAAGALLRARLEPTPTNVEAARSALWTVARLVGALAPSPAAASSFERARTLFRAQG